MPTIPLFDPQRNQDLQSTGSIAPATVSLATSTANLFLSEGRALSEKIEAQSAKAEAQMKAPIIATAYADGLTKIAQGNFEGFSRMEQANAMTAGNPFLMKFAEGARSEATQIARNFLDNKLSERRIQAEKDIHASDTTAAITKGRESSYTVALRQAQAAQAKQDEEDQSAEAADKQFRIDHPEQAAKTPPFQRRPPVKTPSRAEFGLSNKFYETGIPLPTESGTDYQSQPGVIPSASQMTQPATQPVTNVAQPTTTPQQQDAQRQKDFSKVSIGPVNVWVPKVEQDESSSTSTYKMGNVTKRFTDKGKNKEEIKVVQDFSDKIREVKDLPEDFRNWSGQMLHLGYKVTVNKDGTASATNGQETQYFTDSQTIPTEDKKGTITVPPWDKRGRQLTIPEKDVQKWNDAKGAMEYLGENGLLQMDGVGKGVTSTPAERKQIDDTSKLKFADPKISGDERKKINMIRADQGLTQLTEKDITNPVVVNDSNVKRDEVIKKAGLDPNQKDWFDNAKEAVSGFVKKIANLGTQGRMDALEQEIQKNEDKLHAVDAKTNPYSVKLYAAQIVRYREMIEQLKSAK